MVFAAYGDGHVDRTFPVGIGKHFEHHQFALVEGAFRAAVGVSQQDSHVFGDGVAQCFRYFHAGTADSFLVDLHYDAVGRDDTQSFLIRAYPVFEDILQFVRVFSELFFQFVHYFRISVFERAVCLRIHLVDVLFYFRTDGDVFVLSLHVFHTIPGDRERRRVVGRTFHLVDVPVGLQVTEVTGTCVGTETFCFLIVPQRESIVVTVGEDDRIPFFLQCHQVVLTEVTGYEATAAVVIVPRLSCHLNGNKQAEY